MNAAIYLRKSRAEENDLDTLARHREQLVTFAAGKHISVIKTFEEVVSGERLYARPQMLELLADVEAEKYDAVLCMDIDRLGRGAMSEQGIIIETFKNSGCKIITPRKVYDLNDDIDEQYTEMESFLARQELKMIKRRMQRGTQKTKAEGGHVANPPYGYKRGWDGKRPTLEIVEHEADFVRLIFSMYIEGAGGTAIANQISEMGAVPRRGKKFGRTSIIAMLRNMEYLGHTVSNRIKHIKGIKHKVIYKSRAEWMIVKNTHPAIIDENTFKKAGKILEGRYHPPANTGEVKNPLAGLIVCEKCGSYLQRIPFKKSTGQYTLFCTTPGCCTSTRLDRAESAVLDYIREYLAQIESGKMQRRENGKTATEALKRERKAVDEQMSRLYDFLEQGVYTVEVFVERQRSIKIKQAAIDASLQKYKNLETQKDFVNQVRMALEAYEQATPEGKNQLLKSIIGKVYYFKSKEYKPAQFDLSVVMHETID
ncbi:MAG TPA: recombinase family protein [Ruminococcaceae bacterium]|nr:recombinase family protein [Oscillospiraceae bacterium]